jgi:hypothetical protein
MSTDVLEVRAASITIEAARTPETSVDIQFRTRQYIPEDSELRGYDNFSHLYSVSSIHLLALLGETNFYEGGTPVRRPPMKWSAIVESLRNTVEISTGNPQLKVLIYGGEEKFAPSFTSHKNGWKYYTRERA